MSLVETEVRTIQIDALCDNCHKGYYRPNGITLDSLPPQFLHICNKCDHRETFPVTYPHNVYRT